MEFMEVKEEMISSNEKRLWSGALGAIFSTIISEQKVLTEPAISAEGK